MDNVTSGDRRGSLVTCIARTIRQYVTAAGFIERHGGNAGYNITPLLCR